MQYNLGLICVLKKYVNKLDTCIELIKILVHAFSYLIYDL